MRPLFLLLGVLIVTAAGCAQAPSEKTSSQGLTPAVVGTSSSPLEDSSSRGSLGAMFLGTGKIEHIVVIVQENRTVDNLFNGFPGADTVRSGRNSRGKSVALVPIPMTAPYDLSHKHRAWVSDYDRGNMDRFNKENINCYVKRSGCPDRGVAAYRYVPQSETMPYWQMAEQYAFADKMFETNQGPSFPAHQYIVSGTSTIHDGSNYRASENPVDPKDRRRQGGCNSQNHTTVETIDALGNEGYPVFPCFQRKSIMGLMNARSVSWRYYQEFSGAGEWHAVDAIEQIWDSPSYEDVVYPSSQVLTDIFNGRLADVTFVTPSAAASDHSGRTDGSGPSWVASIVNAIGQSAYWNHTAIIVTWDDWGGWYDHVPPKVYNSYELGFRVPMIVISPYVKRGYLSHSQHEFGSILKFIEKTFNLGSLGTTDVRSDNLSDIFNFHQRPLSFNRILAPLGPKYFLSRPASTQDPDDDF
jgi:phospholipase C